MMDERSRELLDRVRAVVEERDALLRDRREWKERVELDAYLAEHAGRERAERDRDRLRALPVIATCGSCGWARETAPFNGPHVICSMVTHNSRGWRVAVPHDHEPPKWCPMRKGER